MPTTQSMRDDFQNGPMSEASQIRLRYFTISGATTDYDDDKTYTQSGNDVWTSGLVMPIDQSRGSNEAVLVEQGRLLQDDLKVYTQHDTDTSGLWTLGIGSPVGNVYKMAEAGVIAWRPRNEIIYKKVYCRYLTNGSLF